MTGDTDTDTFSERIRITLTIGTPFGGGIGRGSGSKLRDRLEALVAGLDGAAWATDKPDHCYDNHDDLLLRGDTLHREYTEYAEPDNDGGSESATPPNPTHHYTTRRSVVTSTRPITTTYVHQSRGTIVTNYEPVEEECPRCREFDVRFSVRFDPEEWSPATLRDVVTVYTQHDTDIVYADVDVDHPSVPSTDARDHYRDELGLDISKKVGERAEVVAELTADDRLKERVRAER